jgi:hypothetical protein
MFYFEVLIQCSPKGIVRNRKYLCQNTWSDLYFKRVKLLKVPPGGLVPWIFPSLKIRRPPPGLNPRHSSHELGTLPLDYGGRQIYSLMWASDHRKQYSILVELQSAHKCDPLKESSVMPQDNFVSFMEDSSSSGKNCFLLLFQVRQSCSKLYWARDSLQHSPACSFCRYGWLGNEAETVFNSTVVYNCFPAGL